MTPTALFGLVLRIPLALACGFLALAALGATPDQEGLIDAIQARDMESAYRLLKKARVDPNFSTELGTPLTLAIQQADVDLIDRLLRSGANPNFQSATQGTPLVQAAFMSSDKTVKKLLRAGANPNLPSVGNVTPLIAACAAGDIPVIMALLNAKASPLAKSDDGLTPLAVSAAAGNASAVELLLKKQTNINDPSKNGDTVLHLAISGALSPQTSPFHGSFPRWYIASEQEHLKTIKLLVQAGANLFATNSAGKTALQVAEETPTIKDQGRWLSSHKPKIEVVSAKVRLCKL